MSATCIQPLLDLQRSVVSALPVQDRIDDSTFTAHDDLATRADAQNHRTTHAFPLGN